MNQKARLENELSLWQLSIDDYVAGLQWSSDNRLIYAASAAGTLYILERESGNIRWKERIHPEGINTLASSPTQPVVLTAGKDGKVQMRDGSDGKLIQTLEAGSLWVEHLAWSQDGKHFASAAGKTLNVWTAAGELLFSWKEFASTISALYWRNEEELAVACYGTILLFTIQQPSPRQVLFWKTPMVSLTWSRNGRFLLAGTQDARIQVWQLPYVPGSELEMNGYTSKVKELSWHNSGEWLATNCGAEIVLWNMAGKGPEGQRPLVLKGHVGKITRLAFQHTGDLLVSADVAGLILIRHPKNTQIRIEGFSESPVCGLEWSPDDEYILFGSEKGEIMLWETPF
jgi:WD40 repeat protein